MMLEEFVEPEQESAGEEMPSFNHSYICWQISQRLSGNGQIAPLPELTLNIGNGITPDISVFPIEKIRPNFLRDIPRFPEMPLLAIEVISAIQNIQDLLDKAQMLVAQGVKAVWTVEPFTNTVFVTDKTGEKRFHNEVVESEGIQVDFRQIFGAN
jgi:Uma2 family endonuclease